jgi:hypothetical protein
MGKSGNQGLEIEIGKTKRKVDNFSYLSYPEKIGLAVPFLFFCFLLLTFSF